MIARFNSYREFETPMLYVCAPGCKYVDGMLTNTSGILTDVSDIEIIPTFNATSELNFRCYRVHREDAEENSHFYSLFRSLRNRRMIYVEDIGFSGNRWTAHVRHVPCELVGHPFEILCADALENQERPNGAAVPPEGVIGYDFFANFTIVVDRLGGKMTIVKN